MKIRSS